MTDSMIGRSVGGGLAISVRGLSKRYGERQAVRGICLDVRVGEVFGLLGPNGAGKTTTLEILEGYRARTAGEVRVLGVDPAHPTRAWRERIGLVPQECRLSQALSVREILKLYGSFYQRPRQVDEVIGLVGLGDERDARLNTLSGGQQRRADVALALIGDPDLIFLDEPTTGFDPDARRGAWRMIEGLRELGKTVLLTTHYMDEAQHLCDRVVIMRDGRIAAGGTPDELTTRLASTTRITFRPPDSMAANTFPAPAGTPVHTERGLVSLETTRPQQVLHRLLAWADQARGELTELEVRRPSLEDIYLDLSHRAADE